MNFKRSRSAIKSNTINFRQTKQFNIKVNFLSNKRSLFYLNRMYTFNYIARPRVQALKSFNYDFIITNTYRDVRASQIEKSNINTPRRFITYVKAVPRKKRKKLSIKRTWKKYIFRMKPYRKLKRYGRLYIKKYLCNKGYLKKLEKRFKKSRRRSRKKYRLFKSFCLRKKPIVSSKFFLRRSFKPFMFFLKNACSPWKQNFWEIYHIKGLVLPSFTYTQVDVDSVETLLFKYTKKFIKASVNSLTIYKLRRSYIFSQHNSSLIVHHNGMILPYKFKFKFATQRSFILNKDFYSFLKPNELKKSILDSRKKFIFTKVIKLLKLNRHVFKRLLLSNRNIIALFTNSTTTPVYSTYLYATDKIRLQNVKLRTQKESHINDLRIPRVKFKPGYQRLWRNFRLAFAESIDFKFIYQQQLTRHLTKFYRKLNQKYFNFNENSVINTIIYSRLVPDLATFTTFFENQFIFLNGVTLTNRTIFVYRNDFIQIEITNWYYIFFRWLRSYVLKRNLKFKSLVYKKSLAGKYKVMKQIKQRSNYTPKWIFTARYDFADIKPFLEVDFFTLSMFIIYDYNLLLYYAPGDFKVTRYNLIRLYNWKYIN